MHLSVAFPAFPSKSGLLAGFYLFTNIMIDGYASNQITSKSNIFDI